MAAKRYNLSKKLSCFPVKILTALMLLMLVTSPSFLTTSHQDFVQSVLQSARESISSSRSSFNMQQSLPIFESLEIEVLDKGTIYATYSLVRPQIYLPAFNYSVLSNEVKSRLLAAGLWVSKPTSSFMPFQSQAMLLLWINTSDESVAKSHGALFISSVLNLPPDSASLQFTTKLFGTFPFGGLTLEVNGATLLLYGLHGVNAEQYFSMVEKAFGDYGGNNSIAQAYLDQFNTVDQVTFYVLRIGTGLEDLIQGVGARLINMMDKLRGTHSLSVKSLLGMPSGSFLDVSGDHLNVTIMLPRVNPATVTSSPSADHQEIIPDGERSFFILDSPDDRYYRLTYSLTQSISDITVQFDYTFHPPYREEWAEVGIFVSPFGTATRRFVLRSENATLSEALFNELQQNATFQHVKGIEIHNEFINNTLPDGNYKLPFLPFSGFFFFSSDVFLDPSYDNVTVVEALVQLLNQTLFDGNGNLSYAFRGDTTLSINDREVPVKRYEINIEGGSVSADQAYNLTVKLVNSPAWNMSEMLRTISFNLQQKGYYQLQSSFYRVDGWFTTEDYWGAELSITWPIVSVFNGPTGYQIWSVESREHQVIPEDIFGFSDLNVTNSNIRGFTLIVMVPVESDSASALNVPLGMHEGYQAYKGFFPAKDVQLGNNPSIQLILQYLYQSLLDVNLDFYLINVWSSNPSYNDTQNNVIPVKQLVVDFNYTMQDPNAGLQIPMPFTIGFLGDRETSSLVTTSHRAGLQSTNNQTNIVYFGQFDHQFERFNGTETLLFLIQDDYGVYLNGTNVTYPNDIFNITPNSIWNHWLVSSGITSVSVTFRLIGIPDTLEGAFVHQGQTSDHFTFNGTDVIFANFMYTWNGSQWASTDPGMPPPFLTLHAMNFTWDTTKYADGFWEIVVNASNANGKWAVSRFTLNVDNYEDDATSPPTITILNSSEIKDGAILRGSSATLAFNMTDDVGIFGAYITIDNQSFLLDPVQGTFTWDISNTWEGQHVISITVIDYDGYNTTVTIFVHVDQGADPFVEVLNPANNTVLHDGESTTLIVRATDDRGIASVELSIDGGNAEQLSTSDGKNYTKTLNAGDLGNGTHVLLITARDVDMYSHEVSLKLVIIVNLTRTTTTEPITTSPTQTTGRPTPTSTTPTVSTPSFDAIMVMIAVLSASISLKVMRKKRGRMG